MPNPISLREIQDHQQRDNDLTRLAAEEPERFPINLVSNTPLITVKGVKKQYPNDWKIFVPPYFNPQYDKVVSQNVRSLRYPKAIRHNQKSILLTELISIMQRIQMQQELPTI